MNDISDKDRDAFDKWGYSPLEGPIRSIQDTAWVAWQAAKDYYVCPLSKQEAIEIVDVVIEDYIKKFKNSPDTEEVVRIVINALSNIGVKFKQQSKGCDNND